MFKTILVPYVNTRSQSTVLDSALALAAAHRSGTTAPNIDAHLALLIAIEIPVLLPDTWATGSSETFSYICDAAHARAKALADNITQRCKLSGIEPEIRLVQTMGASGAKVASLHARYADICIVPSASGVDGTLAHYYFSTLLMHAGRPVLAIPELKPASPNPKRVVIAWQPTRETTRAVHDAMGFLQAAENVDVLVIDPEVGAGEHGEHPGADIATHLARYGLNVNVSCMPSSGRSVAQAINEFVMQSGADLLIAGGYGHNRLQEFLLGGVTRELLQSAAVPVLFSH